MDRKLKILKAVLLLRQKTKYESKEKQIANAERFYSDAQLDEWIEYLKNPIVNESSEPEYSDYNNCKKEHYTPCSINNDYSPTHPWDAPGMNIRDFI